MLKPIKTKKQHEDALERVYNLMQKNLEPGSKDSKELEKLSIIVEKYESKRFNIDYK